MVQTGCDGGLKIGNAVIGFIDSFSVNFDIANAETTSIGSKWADYVETKKSWSGSASATLDHVAHKTIMENITSGTGAKLAAIFKCGDKVSISGNILISSVGVTVTQGDKSSMSFNFTGSGAPTIEGFAASES